MRDFHSLAQCTRVRLPVRRTKKVSALTQLSILEHINESYFTRRLYKLGQA